MATLTDKVKLGYIEGFASILVNTVLFLLKLWAGTVSGSVAMLADAWHTLSDSVSSVMLIGGFWVTSKEPDDRHPFGHGRAENIAGIIMATLLAAVGFNFFIESLSIYRTPEIPSYGRSAVMIFVFSAIIKEILARFSIWAGRKTDSSALKADGAHHRSDALTTLIILVGIFFGRDLPWVDPLLGIIISGFIVYASVEVIREASGGLVGAALSYEKREEIISYIEENFPEASFPHHFHIHKYGEHTEMTMHIHLPSAYPLKKAHDIIDSIEKGIFEEYSIRTTIHPAPSDINKEDT